MSLLAINDLRVTFSRRLGIAGSLSIRAVDGVSLTIDHGMSTALVGESGSGKTTLARVVVGLQQPTAGSVAINGKEIATLGEGERRRLGQQIGYVPQNPYLSLPPRRKALEILTGPLEVHGVGSTAERRRRAESLWEMLGLPASKLNAYPSSFSGGERQRIAIGRALALEPRLLVCDEPVSSLDVSVRASVINLLSELKQTLGISLLLISHDLSPVRHLCERTAVMYFGHIVEEAPTAKLLHAPTHPYTRALIAATPSIAGQGVRESPRKAEPPNPTDPPSGCPYIDNCSWARPSCSSSMPPEEEIDRGWRVACHRLHDPDGPLLSSPPEQYNAVGESTA